MASNLPYPVTWAAKKPYYSSVTSKTLSLILKKGYQLNLFEVPTIQGWIPRMIQSKINNGMRSGIPKDLWRVVLTVYKDADQIVNFLGNANPKNARAIVLSEQGKVLYQYDAGFSVGALNSLSKFFKAKSDCIFQKGALSKLTSDSKTKLSYIFQKAIIKVDEEGTEAAAVTGGGATTTSVPVSFGELKINGPFAYAIRDINKQVTLFEGVVRSLK